MWNKKSGTEENTAISPFREIPALGGFTLHSAQLFRSARVARGNSRRILVRKLLGKHTANNEPFEEFVHVTLRRNSGSTAEQRHCIGGLEVTMTATVMVAVF